MKRVTIIVAVVLLFMMLLPFTAAAITDSQTLGVLDKVIKGVLDAGKQAYCALGVTALC